MRYLLLIAAFVLFGCAKYEVDIEALNNNPFDPDWNGPSFMTIDSVQTVALVPGAIYQQRIFMHLDARLLLQTDNVIQAIETTVPDTLRYATSWANAQGQLRIDNQQVQLGNEYCFEFDVLVDGNALTNHRISQCYVAAL